MEQLSPIPEWREATAADVAGAPLFHAAWLFALGIGWAAQNWLRPGLLVVALGLTAAVAVLAAWGAERLRWLPLGLLWLLLGAWSAEMEPRPVPDPVVAAASDNLLRTAEGTVAAASAMEREAVIEPAQRVYGEAAESLPPIVGGPTRPVQKIDLKLSALEWIDDNQDTMTPSPGELRLDVRWPEEKKPEDNAATTVARPKSRADSGAAGGEAQTAAASVHNGAGEGSGASQPMASFRCGERLRLQLRLTPPEGYRDPGVWSRTDFLLEQGISATAPVEVAGVERLGEAPGSSLACRLTSLERAASARLLALPGAMERLPAPLRLSPEDAIMLAAMITGDRSSLHHSLRVGFERTGSFHMLVVSGFHLAIVSGFVFWLARRLRLGPVTATAVTLALSVFYALFTGMATPVERALAMIAIYLVGRLLFRQRQVMNTIGFAALCLLAVSPHSLFESSLQMTLLAVVSIGGVAAPLLALTIHPYVQACDDLPLTALDVKLAPPVAGFRVLLRWFAQALVGAAGGRRWLGSGLVGLVRLGLRVVELIVVSLVVELAMVLPMALYFHRITLLALPVNVLLLPLLVVLLPLALLTLFGLMLGPWAAMGPAAVVALLLHGATATVRFFGSLHWGDLRMPAPLLGQSLAYCALLGASLASAQWGLRRQRRAAALAAVATLGLAAAVVLWPRPVVHPADGLLVEAIDVGQGDALLLITPDGRTLLVDGGGPGGGPRNPAQEFDVGEEVVSEVLWSRGIRRLDAVALSHAHSDHIGGLPAVLRNFRPRELWVGDNPPVEAYEELLRVAAEQGTVVRPWRAGDSFRFGATEVRVLAPVAGYRTEAEPGNNDSLVLRVGYGATAALLSGDAEAPIERAMMAEPGLGSAVLKVGHHGSLTSTTPEFLARVQPQWALISCGRRNRYGHPRHEILGELEAAGVRTFSTDIDGASCLELDGKSVRPEFDCGLNADGLVGK